MIADHTSFFIEFYLVLRFIEKIRIFETRNEGQTRRASKSELNYSKVGSQYTIVINSLFSIFYQQI
jgi:hypothetical protein